jgi:hypothetical protein
MVLKKKSINIWRALAIAFVCALILCGIGWRMGLFQPFGIYQSSNSLLVIAPYRHAGTWVFDDRARGLKKEPFVAGIPELIDQLVADIPDADEGFRLTFGIQEFPGYEDRLVWLRKGSSGNWYRSETFKAEGWLCPALLKYFPEAPKEIYVKADAK